MVDISKISFGGQSAGAGTYSSTFATQHALHLKVWAGEVLSAFESANVMMPLHTVRSISSGKSAQFPVSGQASTAYFQPGQDILTDSGLLSNVQNGERVINIDDLLTSSTFVDSLDEAQTHWDLRSIYTTEMGRALATKMDQQLLQLVARAARDTGTTPGGAGTRISMTAVLEADLIAAIFSAAQALDEKNVPEDDRYCVIPPAHYYTLVAGTKALNRDWGGSGVYAEGSVLKVAGISIIKSNNVPITSMVSDSAAGQNNTYGPGGDFSETRFVVFHKSAIGTVKLMDMAMESEYLIERQGNLMVAKFAVGHGILRPEAAVEVLEV